MIAGKRVGQKSSASQPETSAIYTLRPRTHAHCPHFRPILHFFAQIDGSCGPSPSIGASNIHIRQERQKMKLKNDKTNPFSHRVALAETGRPAGKMLSFAINTAQKIHNITGEMTKLGPPKIEQTKPTFCYVPSS